MSASASQLLSESLIGLYDAARRLPAGRGGRPVSFGCVLRWITSGIPGPAGQRVKLEAIRVGGRWLTSVEALARWAERLTPRLDHEPPPNGPRPECPRPRTYNQRQRAAVKAVERLEEAGI